MLDNQEKVYEGHQFKTLKALQIKHLFILYIFRTLHYIIKHYVIINCKSYYYLYFFVFLYSLYSCVFVYSLYILDYRFSLWFTFCKRIATFDKDNGYVRVRRRRVKFFSSYLTQNQYIVDYGRMIAFLEDEVRNTSYDCCSWVKCKGGRLWFNWHNHEKEVYRTGHLLNDSNLSTFRCPAVTDKLFRTYLSLLMLLPLGPPIAFAECYTVIPPVTILVRIHPPSLILLITVPLLLHLFPGEPPIRTKDSIMLVYESII